MSIALYWFLFWLNHDNIRRDFQVGKKKVHINNEVIAPTLFSTIRAIKDASMKYSTETPIPNHLDMIFGVSCVKADMNLPLDIGIFYYSYKKQKSLSDLYDHIYSIIRLGTSLFDLLNSSRDFENFPSSQDSEIPLGVFFRLEIDNICKPTKRTSDEVRR